MASVFGVTLKATQTNKDRRATVCGGGYMAGNNTTTNNNNGRHRSPIRNKDMGEDDGMMDSSEHAMMLGRHRQSLRPVRGLKSRKKVTPKRSSSRKYKLESRSAPFYVSSSPTFGVILKSVPRGTNAALAAASAASSVATSSMASSVYTDDASSLASSSVGGTSLGGGASLGGGGDDSSEMEPMFDLAFKEGEEHSKPEMLDQKVGEDEVDYRVRAQSFFGVRLKPSRKKNHRKNPLAPRTYQVDLTPPPEAGKGSDDSSYVSSYQSLGRAFLEIKLKPVMRGNQHMDNSTCGGGTSVGSTSSADASAKVYPKSEEKPKFVELQLRHVVAPADGGPKRTVTEASFQIPFLKHLDLAGIPGTPNNNPLQEMLQLTIEGLKHTLQNTKIEDGDRHLQIRLRHVHPDTGAVTDLGQTIQVQLRSRPLDEEKRVGEMPPSMRVSLKHVEPNHKGSGLGAPASHPGLSKVRVKDVNVMEHQNGGEGMDTLHHRKDGTIEDDHDEESVSSEYEEFELDDEYEEEEMVDASMKSLPEMNPGEAIPTIPSSDTELSSPVPEEVTEEELVDQSRVKNKGDEFTDEEVTDPEDSEEEEEYEEYTDEETGEKKRRTILVKKKKDKKKKDKKKKKNKKKKAGDLTDEEAADSEYSEETVSDEAEVEEYEEYTDEEDGKKKRRTILVKKKKDKKKKKEKKKKKKKDKKNKENSENSVEKKVTGEGAGDSGANGEKNEEDPRSRPTRRVPQRTRSSSLTDFDRMRARRDHWINVKGKQVDEERQKRELTMKQKRDLLMWYNRMKTPNKERMKERVAMLPPSCDITPDDVELLPWLCKGRYLDLRVMNQYFMEEWQGAEDKKKTEQQTGNESD